MSPLPLPPNRTGGFPASGSPVSRSSVGLTKRTVGCAQVKQTQVREVGVGPAMMISAATTAATSRPPAQDAAHSHAHPFVQSGKRRPVTVFEVVKPAAQARIQPPNDHQQRVPVGAPGQLPDLVFQLVQALGPRPAVRTLEVIPQEVESPCLAGVNQSRLARVQGERAHYRSPYPYCGKLGPAFLAAELFHLPD